MKNFFKNIVFVVVARIIVGLSIVIPTMLAYFGLGMLVGRPASAAIMILSAMLVYSARSRKHYAKLAEQQQTK